MPNSWVSTLLLLEKSENIELQFQISLSVCWRLWHDYCDLFLLCDRYHVHDAFASQQGKVWYSNIDLKNSLEYCDFQQMFGTGDIYWMLSPSAALIGIESLVFLFCYFGDHFADAFDDVTYNIFHTKWHFYSHNMKRSLVTIMILSGKPVRMRGWRSLYCTRDLFTQVTIIVLRCSDWIQMGFIRFQIMKSGFSCFMMLRQFDQ